VQLYWAKTKRGRFFWLFFIQFLSAQDHMLSTTGDADLVAGLCTYWAPLEMLTWVQDHILSTTGDAYLVAGSHTERHWRCLLSRRITYWAPLEMLACLLTYLLTYLLFVFGPQKQKKGRVTTRKWGERWALRHWKVFSSLAWIRYFVESEREKELNEQQHDLKQEKRGGRRLGSLDSPTGCDKEPEWRAEISRMVTAHQGCFSSAALGTEEAWAASAAALVLPRTAVFFSL
jgi:hypothetical protein